MTATLRLGGRRLRLEGHLLKVLERRWVSREMGDGSADSSSVSGPSDGAVVTGTFELAGRTVSVDRRSTSPAIEISVAGAGRFRVERAPVSISARDVDERGAEAALAGPVLLLALALLDRYCWHASAILQRDGRALAFCGDSGAGKSTLARRAELEWPEHRRRAADDLLLFGVDDDAALVYPGFPQPRLSRPENDAIVGLPESVPLRAVVRLEHRHEDREVALRRLAGTEAVRVLVEESVALRLFEPAMLARHLDVCTAVAGRVPVFRARYPHRPEAVDELLAAVEAELGRESLP